MSFPDRLKSLRSELKISQAQLAETLEMNERTLRRYEAGAFEPTMSVLIEMARLFNCSIDYLCGYSYDKAVHNPVEPTTQEKFRKTRRHPPIASEEAATLESAAM